MLERDFATQEGVQEYQRKLERNLDLRRFRRFFALTMAAGISVIGAIKLIDAILDDKEKTITSEELTTEVAPVLTTEVKPKAESPIIEPKTEIAPNEIKSEPIQDRIERNYQKFNKNSDFAMTFDINDKDHKQRQMIEKIANRYGDPEYLQIYIAIAAKESRLKNIDEIGGGKGKGLYQITNIPKSIEKKADELERKGELTPEEGKVFEGIRTFDSYMEQVKEKRAELGLAPDEQEEIIFTLLGYNRGLKYLDFSKSAAENCDKFQTNYPFETLAFEKAEKEGYTH